MAAALSDGLLCLSIVQVMGVTTRVGWSLGIVGCLTVGNEIYNLGL